MNWKIKASLSMAVAMIAMSGCNGGGSSNSSSGGTAAAASGGSASTTPAPMNAAACAAMTGCTDSNNTFTFPDGSGGTITCANGSCSDNTSYNSGYNAGNNDGYNQGYSAGAAANAGSGYNQGYSDGQTAGYNSGYSDGQTAGYNSGYNDGYNSGYNDGYSAGYSDGSSGNSFSVATKDVDLQKANVQQKDQNARAEFIANQFQMSVTSALQLTQLADKVQQMTKAGQMTADDRTAVSKSALGIAGISTDEVNDAFQKSINGDTSAADDLLEKAAKNLGMSSSASLRDQLLPALGVNLD